MLSSVNQQTSETIMQTQGHLVNDGGIRAHSAGLIYPYRIMAQGLISNLTWWVINPQGKKCGRWCTPDGAQAHAELIIEGYLSEKSYE